MTNPVSMLGLATAVPPYVLEQVEIARRAETAFADTFARFPQLAEVQEHRHRAPLFGAPHRLVRARARLDRADDRVSRQRDRILHRGG